VSASGDDGGTGGITVASDPCAGGATWPASDGVLSAMSSAQGSGQGQIQLSSATQTLIRGYGQVQFRSLPQAQVIRLQTTLAVPAKPPPSGALFLWPGLEPLQGGENFNPIGEGVLQSVLAWGNTCAASAPNNYDAWWISAQYVNTVGNYSGFTGCHGSPGIDVSVGDLLDIDMVLGGSSGTEWTQTVSDPRAGGTTTFAIDMQQQAQNAALFTIQGMSAAPVSDVVFTGTTITMASPDPDACQPSLRGQTDYFAPPRVSTDGTRCCVSKIILRASGVAPTTPNTP
jgi:hypothetical protein